MSAVRLHRLHNTISGPVRSWLISGTNVRLTHDPGNGRGQIGPWKLRAYDRRDTNEDTRRWLTIHGLRDHRFPTRRAALRAFEATAASDPLPSPRRCTIGSLRRVRAGHHQIYDVHVTKKPGERLWQVRFANGATMAAITLRAAHDLIERHALRFGPHLLYERFNPCPGDP